LFQGQYFQHVFGLSLSGLNERSEKRNPVYQDDQLVRTDITTTDSLKLFLGPNYTLRWKDLFLRGGVALRLGQGDGPNYRFLVQLGFMPWGLL